MMPIKQVGNVIFMATESRCEALTRGCIMWYPKTNQKMKEIRDEQTD